MKAALSLIDVLDGEIDGLEDQIHRLVRDDPKARLLMSAHSGIGFILAHTIMGEIGDISRFTSAKRLCGHTGLCPRVCSPGGADHRGSLAKNGPKHLRWALIEAATHACRHPLHKERHERTAAASGASAGGRSPGSSSPVSSPRRSSTCWAPTSPSARPSSPSERRERHEIARPGRPLSRLWSYEDPRLSWATGTSLPSDLIRGESPARER